MIYETPALHDLAKDVSRILQIPISAIIGSSRKRPNVMARFVFTILAYTYTHYTLIEIGVFINRDHTSIIYQRDTAKHLMKTQETEFMKRWNKYVLSSVLYQNLKPVKRKHLKRVYRRRSAS